MTTSTSKKLHPKTEIVYNRILKFLTLDLRRRRIMESVELKLREIDNDQFPVVLTRNIVKILREPEMSIEIKTGHTEDVSQLLDSLGYDITAKKPMDGWIMLRAVKLKK
jgi:hypothetical protein